MTAEQDEDVVRLQPVVQGRTLHRDAVPDQRQHAGPSLEVILQFPDAVVRPRGVLLHQERVRGGAGEKLVESGQALAFQPQPAQHAVAFPAHQLHLHGDDVARHVVLLQHPREDLHRSLELFRYDLVGAQARQPRDLGHVPRPDDDVEVGIEPPGVRHHARRRRRVADGHHQHARTRHARSHENRRTGGVAEFDRFALVLDLPRNLRVQVQYPARDVHLLQHPGQVPPVDPVADDDDVPGHLVRGRPFGLLAAVQREPQAPAAEDQQRGHQHAEDRGREKELLLVRREDLESAAHPREDERELAHLGQRQAQQQTEPERTLQEREDGGDQASLDEHQQQPGGADQGKFLAYEDDLHLHSQGDEEDARKTVPQREDVGDHLVAVLRIRDQQTGDERPQGKRDAGLERQPGGAETDEQHAEEKDFLVPQPGHLVEEPRHDETRCREDQPHRQHRLSQRERHDLEGERIGLPQHRHRQHHGHGDDVLEQQRAHREPAVKSRQLVAVAEDLEHDGGAAEGGEQAEEEAEARGIPEVDAHRGHHEDGEADLQEAARDDQRLYRQEPLEGEFQADGEEQQHDADLRQDLQLVSVADDAEAVGPHDDAHRQKADDRRQPQLVEGEDRGHREGQDGHETGEDVQHGGGC